MTKQTPAQQRSVARVMHEFKHGELDKPDGTPVENPTQAIAIALRDAGTTRSKDAATNTRSMRPTKRK